ncbi:alpha/beta fold hydrolase [Leptolyngbya cf. ectocarpi LEGE 11479]|uniref:Alpha/beta fold hydrolase n=1 Tax=Leptolyngbya cf. ectocarpi LEGE 11479 TaxID=1828722 RepID=A0A928WY86_LEPEC|nr:alpha/beta fold hydrolase [Leptolyngbya ectocarpi]MBE9065655.1 alpha/beta fold hydrolase [Leptolyngbya cf. ectocarpi LEGE 11479]
MSRFSTWIDLLQHRAKTQRDQTAYVFLQDGEQETLRLSYQQLDTQARAIAAQLHTLGGQGERALLLYPSGLEFIAAFLGCLYAGVIAVPAYPPRPNQKMTRLSAIVTDADAKLLLTTQGLLQKIESQFSQDLDILHFIATDGIANHQAEHWQKPDISSDTLAFLQYTSGSTGTPKGVMVSHSNLLCNCASMVKALDLRPDSVMVSWLPSFHDMGLILGMLKPLSQGVPTILMPPTAFVQRPLRWLQAISHYRATHSGGPNFAYELCINKVKSEQLDTLDLSSWRCALNGAEPVRRQTLERFTQKFKPYGFRSNALFPCYGMAEATLMISGGLADADPIYSLVEANQLEQNQILEASSNIQSVRSLTGCGRALLDTRVVIADPDTRTQCAPNQVGEIWTSGLSVAQGYWQRPGQTQETFDAHLQDTGEGPFLRTGDLGFLQSGELYITGRLKDVVIIRGRNHYPQDIELTVQQSHPALKPESGAAFAIDMENEEQLVVVQEVRRQALRHLDVAAIAAAIRRAIAEEHDLQVYAIVLLKTASILKTSSGKIQRQACKKGFLMETLNVVGEWRQPMAAPEPAAVSGAASGDASRAAPPTEAIIQAWLEAKLSTLLRMPPQAINPQMSLVQYGLDSLTLVTLASELEEWLGFQLPSQVVYEHPTMAALAHALAHASPDDHQRSSCLVPLQSQGTKPPFFCIHPLAGVVFPYYPLVRVFGHDRPFWALQSVGLEGGSQPLTTIEAMAAHYLEALLQLQPQDPYYLGGWSFGAYVALEMATQLRQQGQRVAKVVLLDTPPLSTNKLTNLVDLTTFFLTSSAPHIWPYVADYAHLRLAGEPSAQAPDLWTFMGLLTPDNIARLIEQESRLMTFRQPALQGLLQVIQANTEAMLNYQPKPYPGKITLFHADPVFGNNRQDAVTGWLKFAMQGTEVYKIPGHHFSLLRSPHVETLARKLNNCLDEV